MKLDYDSKLKMVELINEDNIDMPKVLRFDLETFKSIVMDGYNILDQLESNAWNEWFSTEDDISFEQYCEEEYNTTF